MPKSVFDTFNPDAVVPLAMKKFELDLAKRKLDLMESEHNFALENTKREAEREINLRNEILNIAHDREIAELPKVEGGGGGMFPIPEELSGFGNKMIDEKLKSAGDSKAMLKRIMPYVKDPVKAIESLMKNEEKPEWEAPTTIEGATTQRNSKTGEIKTVVTRPPEDKKDTTLEFNQNVAKDELAKEGNAQPSLAQIKSKMQEIESRTKRDEKGFDKQEDAIADAHKMWNKLEGDSKKMQLPSVEMGPTGKYVPKLIPNPAARGEAFADTRGMQVYDTTLEAVVPKTWKEIKDAPEGRFISTSDPNIVEKIAQAKQRGGATTGNVVSATKMYMQEAPEIIELRQKVHAKGLLPKTKLKSLEAINQWIGTETSDPDAAELKKKTKFLADSLMRVIGGTQGGEWAFKVAADILDPTFSPEAFERIVMSHGTAMRRMAEARKDFGKEKIPMGKGEVPATKEERKELNGKFYIKKNGKWYEE